MRRLAWAVASALVAAGTAFAVVSFADADAGGRYRVATVSVGDVAQSVAVSGTVDRVNRADVSFGTDGALTTLSVAVGDVVSAGQELGSLDTASLQAAVDKAESDIDQAESNLSTAETAVEEAASSSSSDSSDSSAKGPDSSALVQEVKDAQSAASAALKAASDAVAAQTTACADPTAAACAAAGSATLTAQQAVKTAQDTLQTKLDGLSAALASASSDSADSSDSDSSDSSSRPSDGSSDSSASASSVAEAQASVDEAKVKLVEAQQALAGATLKSPITGTVASVASAVGDQVSAGTTVVVVVGEGAADVAATVTVEQLTKLAVGQEATVTPVGTSENVTGTVTRVSTLPDPNAESVAYPVTITVDKPPATMAAGSSASASIVVATAKNVLTVPTSAVNRNSVTVLNGDQPTVTRVTVGAVGPTRTEITEGLSKGQQVVLANLDSPLPTSDQSNQSGFLGGGPGGGGGGPGGGGGGPMMRTRSGN